ncbi:O-antigen ligase family protein [Vibrio sp. Vb0349]|uniref:O-antigen ligase family protein n=1 Tax=Vibrio sp. Vb0349 TaxID=3074624 RepID=UPI00296488B8|nr:O-antigen ligase family protein [Vibrio sp. Vb0349]MDW1917008.1 O-antigen ligase family protein [Vibrio sp. Vb0349]
MSVDFRFLSVSIVFLLLSVELNIGAGVTLGRLAYILTFILFIFLFSKKFSVSSNELTFFSMMMLFFIYASLQSVFLNVNQPDPIRIFNWMVYSLFCFLFSIGMSSLSLDSYTKVVSNLLYIAIFLVIVSILFLIYRQGGMFYSKPAWVIRNELNLLPGGLSRYFFGANVLLLIVYFSSFENKSRTLSLVFSILLILISGSRQFLIVWVLSLLILYLSSPTSIVRLMSFKKLTLLIFSILLGGYFVSNNFNSDYFDSLEKRYTQTVNIMESQGPSSEDSTSERMHFISLAVASLDAKPFGVGAGGVESVIGRPAHNSYAHLMIEFGYIGIFLYILIGVFSVFTSKVRKGPHIALFVIFFITPVFNDVIYMPLFWGCVVFCMYSPIKSLNDEKSYHIS